MKPHILFLIALVCFPFFVRAQQVSYRELDSLVQTNSMIDALTALRKLKEAPARDSLKAAYWIVYSKASFVLYKYSEAKTAIDKAIFYEPKHAKAWYEKGKLYNATDDLKTSLAAFDEAVALKPDAQNYYWRGIVNQRLEHKEAAIADYRSALMLKFETVELCTNLAILFMQTEKYDEALELSNRAVALNKRYGQAYSTRAQAHVCLLNIDSACADKNRAVNVGYRKGFEMPDSVCNGGEEQKWHFNGDFLLSSECYKAAIPAYAKLIDRGYIKSDYYLNRGYAYYNMQEYEKAEKDYLLALSLPGAALEILYEDLCLLYFDKKEYQKSVDYATKQIALNPSNHVPYLDRGIAYRRLKNYEAAENDFNTSLKIKPDFFRAFGYRAYLYFEMGNDEKAMSDALKSIQINPEYGYGYLVLSDIKQKLNMPDFCTDLYKAAQYGEKKAEESIRLFCK